MSIGAFLKFCRPREWCVCGGHRFCVLNFTSHFTVPWTSRPLLFVQGFRIGKACFCIHFLTWGPQHPWELGKGGMSCRLIEKVWTSEGLCACPGPFIRLKRWARTVISRLTVQFSFFISIGGFLSPFLRLRIFGIKKMNHWTQHIINVAPGWICRDSAKICTCHRWEADGQRKAQGWESIDRCILILALKLTRHANSSPFLHPSSYPCIKWESLSR